MTGHSKWVSIQRRKKHQRAHRGKIFTRIMHEITMAVFTHGNDRENNNALRLATLKAKEVKMPDATIEKTIQMAPQEGQKYQKLTYEGFTPGNIAILLECITDDPARTDKEVARVFNHYRVKTGTAGSVAYLFAKNGVISFAPGTKENKIIEQALDAGAEDVITLDDGSIEVLTRAENYVDVLTIMNNAYIKPDDAIMAMHASIEVELDTKTGLLMLKFLDELDQLKDTQQAYHNADIPLQSYE